MDLTEASGSGRGEIEGFVLRQPVRPQFGGHAPLDESLAHRRCVGLQLRQFLHIFLGQRVGDRSEEHTSELQSLMRISSAVFCLNKKISYTRTTSSLSYPYLSTAPRLHQ